MHGLGNPEKFGAIGAFSAALSDDSQGERIDPDRPDPRPVVKKMQTEKRKIPPVYLACDGLAKEAKRLCGFAKTGLLAPGENQCVTISFGAKDIACFNEEKSAWIVESGAYVLQVGNSSGNVAPFAVLKIEQEAVIEQVVHICRLQDGLTEFIPVREKMKRKSKDLLCQAERAGLPEITFSPVIERKKQRLENKYRKEAMELTEKLTEEELIAMVIGEANKAQSSALGSAGVKVPGAAGETSSILEDKWGVSLSREELKDCVGRMLTVIYQTLGYEDCQCYFRE